MLTDPESAQHARTTLGHQIEATARALPAGEDAELRTALIISTLIGITVSHQLLRLDALRDLTPDRIAAALRPGARPGPGTGIRLRATPSAPGGTESRWRGPRDQEKVEGARRRP